MLSLHVAFARLNIPGPKANRGSLHNLLVFSKFVLDVVSHIFFLFSCHDLMLSYVFFKLVETKKARIFGLLPPGVAQVARLFQLLG